MLVIRLKANILPAIGGIAAIQLTDNHLDNYVRARWETGIKYSTITRELNDIQSILNWSAARKPPLIPANPVRNYKKPKAETPPILPPTSKVTNAILSAVAPHLKRVILLSYYLGLRPGRTEMLGLNWSNINWETNEILIISAGKGGPIKRLVPIPLRTR